MSTDQIAVLCIIGALLVIVMAIMGFTKLAWIIVLANLAAIFIIKKRK